MSPGTVSLPEDQVEQFIENLSQLTTYTVGRQPENTICIANGKISSRHARIIQCTADSYVLEDLDSKNGTYVNGARIARKVVDKSDRIRLADLEYTLTQLLTLNASEQADQHPKAPFLRLDLKESIHKANRADLDFTQEFADLKQVFDQYPKLRRDCRSREKMVRTGSVILSSVIGISAVLTTGGGALPLLQIMSSAGLSMLIPTLCSTLLSTDEKLEIIDKEYRERYRCPNPDCRDAFGTREWGVLAQQKTCRRCQAIWVK